MDKKSENNKNTDKRKNDNETRYRERFRLIEMNELLDSFSATCFGRNEDIRPVILTEKGKISKVKLNRFTEELTACADEYTSILRGTGLTDEERELVGRIIFISVIVAGTGYGFSPSDGDYSWEPFSRKISFEDINQLLRVSVPYMSVEDMFFFINQTLSLLGEKMYVNDLAGESVHRPEAHDNSAESEEEASSDNIGRVRDKKNVIRLRDDRMFAELQRAEDEYAEDEELYAKMEEEMLKDYEKNRIPEWVEQKQVDELAELMKHYNDVFPMKEEFLEACRYYGKNVFDVCPDNIDRVFESAINLYLIRTGLSPLADQIEFRHIHAEVSVAESRIERKVWRNRRG